MTDFSHHFRFLGFKCRDRISGFEGVGSSVAFDVFGCIQTCIAPPFKKGDEKLNGGHWFDNNRIEIIDKKRIMAPQFEMPVFASDARIADRRGPADKPGR